MRGPAASGTTLPSSDSLATFVGTGRIDTAEVVRLVQGAAALVHPSLDEGFGMVPLEAMAAGVPTIVSGAGAVRVHVESAALLAGADDADAWAAAIETLVDDDDTRSRLIAEGRYIAAGYTWEAAAKRTIEVHHQVLAAS